jgi:hypothetical protein
LYLQGVVAEGRQANRVRVHKDMCPSAAAIVAEKTMARDHSHRSSEKSSAIQTVENGAK